MNKNASIVLRKTNLIMETDGNVGIALLQSQ
jgi:hypothetical protein